MSSGWSRSLGSRDCPRVQLDEEPPRYFWPQWAALRELIVPSASTHLFYELTNNTKSLNGFERYARMCVYVIRSFMQFEVKAHLSTYIYEASLEMQGCGFDDENLKKTGKR